MAKRCISLHVRVPDFDDFYLNTVLATQLQVLKLSHRNKRNPTEAEIRRCLEPLYKRLIDFVPDEGPYRSSLCLRGASIDHNLVTGKLVITFEHQGGLVNQKYAVHFTPSHHEDGLHFRAAERVKGDDKVAIAAAIHERL